MKRTLLVIALCAVCFILIKTIYGIRTALAVVQLKEERQIDDKIPKHVPIKYKLRKDKEHAFKDLGNEEWLRDFELEVMNVSDKPIYFLEIWLDWPDAPDNIPTGTKNGIALRFGRMAFIDFKTSPLPSDIPILPGETYTFVIPERFQKGWKRHKLSTRSSNPMKVELIFVQLNFGDGTGFHRTDALRYPRDQQTSSTPCREGPESDRAASSTFIALNRAANDQPAALLPVHFFSGSSKLENSSTAIPDLCCPGPVMTVVGLPSTTVLTRMAVHGLIWLHRGVASTTLVRF